MKQITPETLLKQGDNTYQPIEVDGVIYWCNPLQKVNEDEYFIDNMNLFKCRNIFDMGIEDTDGLIHNFDTSNSIIAQSQPKLAGVPVVSLDKDVLSDIETITSWDSFKEHPIGKAGKRIENWFKSNPNQYTQADIEKAIELARALKSSVFESDSASTRFYRLDEILQQINSISVIEVDEQFNVIRYE